MFNNYLLSWTFLFLCFSGYIQCVLLWRNTFEEQRHIASTKAPTLSTGFWQLLVTLPGKGRHDLLYTVTFVIEISPEWSNACSNYFKLVYRFSYTMITGQVENMSSFLSFICCAFGIIIRKWVDYKIVWKPTIATNLIQRLLFCSELPTTKPVWILFHHGVLLVWPFRRSYVWMWYMD